MLSDGPSQRKLPVTAIIPAYKRPEETVRAIRSAKVQRPLPPAEIIVVDDGSEDGTAEAAEAEGVRVIRHEVNRGLAAARNTAVEAAGNDWVALLDSDDEWLPDHLAALWEARNGHVLVANSSLYVSQGSRRPRFSGPALGRPVVLRSPAKLVYPVNIITPSAAMVRRDAVLEADGFKAYSGVVEDFGLWLRMLEAGTAAVLPTLGIVYHLHETQMSNDIERMFEGRSAAIAEHRGSDWLSDGLVERWHGVAAWDHMRVAIAERRRRDALRLAARMLSSPQRIVGVLGVLARRFLIRRRSSTLDRTGQPTVAVLPDVPSVRLGDAAGGDSIVDLRSYGSAARALAHLARYPTSSAVFAHNWEAAVLRALGIQPLRSL